MTATVTNEALHRFDVRRYRNGDDVWQWRWGCRNCERAGAASRRKQDAVRQGEYTHRQAGIPAMINEV